jgi:hypothetical protein
VLRGAENTAISNARRRFLACSAGNLPRVSLSAKLRGIHVALFRG